MSDKELLELIKNDYYRISPKGCIDYMKNRDKRIPCLTTLKKRFKNNTFNEILIMAGVDDDLNFVTILRYFKITKITDVIDTVEEIILK